MARTRKLQQFIEGPRYWWARSFCLRPTCFGEAWFFQPQKAEQMRYSQKWVLSLNAEGKQPPRQLRPDYEEAKRVPTTTRRIMAAKGQLFTPIHARKKDVKNRINNFKDLKTMTTSLIGRQDGSGFRSSRETCRILRLRRLHHGKTLLCSGSHGGGIPRNMMSSEWDVFFSKIFLSVLNSRVSHCRNAVPTIRRGVYVQHHSKIRKRAFWRNSECKDLGLSFTLMDKIYTVRRQRDQVGEDKSLCLRRFVSMCG